MKFFVTNLAFIENVVLEKVGLGFRLVGNIVAAGSFFSQDQGFFCFVWGSGVFIENLGFFDSGQVLEMYVASLYFPLKDTVVSQA